jgi:hypothetical protein
MWPTSDCLGTQGPLDFALFLLNAPPSDTKAAGRGPHKKSVMPLGPSYVLSRLSAIGLLRRAWLQPRQKARLQNRYQSNNNRFKLLPQSSLLQLRLTILTKQGCEEWSRDKSDRPGGERGPQGMCQLDRPLKWPGGSPEAGGGLFPCGDRQTASLDTHL